MCIPKPIKPEDCVAPQYYIEASTSCELCQSSETRGYVKESQSCLSCKDGFIYDLTAQECTLKRIKPEDCVAPQYYIGASASCELCQSSEAKGYIKESQSCLTCEEGYIYETST